MGASRHTEKQMIAASSVRPALLVTQSSVVVLETIPLTGSDDSGSAYRGSNPWGAAKLESITYLQNEPVRKHSDLVLKRSVLAHTGSQRTAHLRHTRALDPGRVLK